MKKLVYALLYLAPAFLFGQEKLQLAPPLLQTDAFFFEDTTYAEIIFGMPEAEVKFELHYGKVKFTNQTYKAPVNIHRTAAFYYWSSHPDYKASAIQKAYFFKKSKAKFTVLDLTTPNKLHPGKNHETLNDGIKAERDFIDPAWMGFADSLIIIRIVPENWPVESLVLSTLEQQNASVFLPKRVEVSIIDHKNQVTILEPILFEPEIRVAEPSYQLIELLPPVVERDKNFEKLLKKGGHIEVKIYPIKHPSWHKEAGNPTWFFVDELFAY